MSIDPYRSHETDIKKLQKLWDGGQDNTNNLDKANDIQVTKTNQITNIQTPELTTKLLRSIGGDFKNISILMTSPYTIKGFTWTITENLPEDWIPMLRIDVEYQYTGGNLDFNNIYTYLNKVLGIQPLPNGFVAATWQIGLFLVSYNPAVNIPDFQAKLVFTFIPPSEAVA